MDITCPENLSSEHSCAVQELLADLSQLPLYGPVNDTLLAMDSDTCAAGAPGSGLRECSKMSKGVKVPCAVDVQISQTHFVLMLLLSWPYVKCGAVNGQQMARLVATEMLGASQVLQNEVAQLRQQFELVFDYTAQCKNCQCRL